MNRLTKFLICVLGVVSVLSHNISSVNAEESKVLKLNATTNVANMEMVVKDNFIKAKYASAENRFLQGNVKAAHDDYADLISLIIPFLINSFILFSYSTPLSMLN